MKRICNRLPELILQEKEEGLTLDILPNEIIARMLELLPKKIDYSVLSKQFYNNFKSILYRHHYTTHVKQRIAMPRINHICKDLGFLWSRIWTIQTRDRIQVRSFSLLFINSCNLPLFYSVIIDLYEVLEINSFEPKSAYWSTTMISW